MIKQYIIIAGCVGVTVFIIIISVKLYPIAIVNGSPIWHRTWDRYYRGALYTLIIQTRAAGTEFNPNASMVSAIKKNALGTLIEDTILAQAGIRLLQNFNAVSDRRIHDAVASSTHIEKAALLMYGFNAADFHDFVLLPQSHREVIQDEFDKQKINFAAWFAGAKKKAHVRFILYPYTWDGDTVK